MTDSQQPENEKGLQQLAWAIESSVGQFKLILARCNYVSLRDRLIQKLREICQVEIRVLAVQQSNRTLYSAIQEEFGEEIPACVMVVGLESVQNLSVMLTSANQVREEFRKNFASLLVLWIDDEIYKQLIHFAPDLESWATTRNFAISTQELVDFIIETANQWFSNNLKFSVDVYIKLETELETAQKYLLNQPDVYNLEIQADLESLLGFIKQINNQKDLALQHYQKALELWQESNNLERQAIILGEIGVGYYLKAFKNPDINHPDWQTAWYYIREYINFINLFHNPDLIANTAIKFGDILRDLQKWETLQSLSEQALVVHQTNNQLRELAKDYGFLAEVALAQKDWVKANQLVQQALEVFAAIPNLESANISGVLSEISERVLKSKDLSLYQFILGRSQYHLGQIQQATLSLETARDVGNPLEDVRLYLDILRFLQQLYFEQKEYLKAYKIKQQRRSIEQQFGLRAFIGAGRLEATKQAFVETLRSNSPQGNIAPEIAASGRLLDVERLIEHMGRPDYKLIVIHGQSGVGKSSLVNAGLVPALKNKAIGIQDYLPVVMRVYTNWVEELGRLLGRDQGNERDEGDERELEPQHSASEGQRSASEGQRSASEGQRSASEGQLSASEGQLSASEGQRSASEPQRSASEGQRSASEGQSSTSELGTPQYLISRLKENEQHNLRTVLIFDQFEEFFFVYTEPAQRKQFFEFLGECLNVLSVKVILSLRVDYIHYLLECNDLSSLKIIGNDILSNNVLYKLGNFSPADTKSIIQRLTENTSFHLEDVLVEQLVQDLAGELGEVRPIELQVVGAQLQTENITTLAEYRQRGTKDELVKRYLDEVVNDCGVENQQVAELLLYLLTDEKGTRPLKTRPELERDLQQYISVKIPPTPLQKGGLVSSTPFLRGSPQAGGSETRGDEAFDISKLDLVLEIVVKSGLVVLLPENPFDRYQLVHDYIALFIRQQQQPKLNELMAELDKERKQRLLTEEELKQSQQAKTILAEANRKATQRIRIGSGVMFISFVLAGIAGVLANQASRLKDEAQTGTRLERQGITAWQYFSSQEIESLLSAMQVGQELQRLVKDGRPLEEYPAASPQLALQTILDNIHERNQLKGHTSYVNSVSFSPDGKRIVTASADKTARVWDISGKQIAELKGHTQPVNSASFSLDGKRIVTASADNTARVWDISGKQIAELKGHTQPVNSASFSPDGKRIVTASADKTARVWDISGKQIAELKGHTSYVNSASFSPDGKHILITSYDTTAWVWDIFGKQITELKGHTKAVNSASFSPDGKRIVTASADNTARVWDISGKQIAELKGHTKAVNSASFSPDGKRIVTASADNTAGVWDISGKQIAELKGDTETVNRASFSPDGKRIVTGSDDKTARVWNIDGKQIAELKGHTSRVNSASFSPDGKRIVTTSVDNTVRVWDISSKQIAELKGHTKAVNSASFSPDGKRIVTGSDDKTARVWDIFGEQIAELKGHIEAVNSASFSPDGKRILTASYDKTARVWDISGKQIAELKGHTNYVNRASFSPDGKRIVTASFDKTARVWDISGKQIAELKGHTKAVYSASFSPDGKRIVTGSDDNTVRVWDISGKQITELKGHTKAVNSVSFSPDGKRILTASFDNTARVWDISGKQIAELKGHTKAVNSASFSPDGKRIVTASADNTARVWDISGKQIAELKGHTKAVNSASFSPDGKRILTASFDKTARVWQVDNLDELLSRGCQWLNDYLVTNPKDLETLKVCQNKSNLIAAAPFLVQEGENEARTGNIDNAVATFHTAFKWNPSLKFDPKIKAQEFANKGNAERLIAEGERIVKGGKVKEALANYAQAQKLDPNVEIPADSWNSLCRQGSLRGYAKDVLFACDKALALAPDDSNNRDSRGLARALTGNTQGAITDFEAYIAQTDDKDSKAQRQRWVKDLRVGKNPFTDAELKKLQN
ncbi:ribosome assembly protein 4 [uncultured Nostoc sp.]|uniref:eIF2A-related protein n=1 Tax=uncultured Nostoc sp. TaxID=340711 RepID=UPI0035C9E859